MELVLPEKYVELDQEEMAYLDGGAYLTANQCWGVCTTLALSPGALIAAATTAVIIKKVLNLVKGWGGPWTFIAGSIISYGTSMVSKLAIGIGKGAISNRGLSVRFNLDIYNFGLQTYIGKASWA